MKRRYKYNPQTDSVEEVVSSGRTNGIVPAYHSEAMGLVTEAEVAPAKELDRKLGLGDVEYDSDLRPVFRSSKDYDKYLKAHQMVNRSSCGKHAHFTPEMFERVKQRVLESHS